jgi:ABC-type glycerol-3-phosphate transport system substrate-binding protein
MKRLSGSMSPDFLTYNSNVTQSMWENGRVALMNAWGSRAGTVIDENAPIPEVAASTAFAAAPTVGGGELPAATLWWDGFVIARNVSDADAEASFRAMMHGISPETAQEHPAAAVWLIEGYEPTPAATGVLATMEAGARPYPTLPYMGLMHTALGNELAEFMQGDETAEQALADASRAYTTAAREAGFLK